jgi:hypothetical protein
MTGDAGLERGYRRLLACYPRRFRDEHGEELLGVLLASARDGQHRPALLEFADLVRNGLGMRLRPDNSRSARQGWSDALAAYSLAGPVLLILTTVTSTVLSLSVNPPPVALILVVAIEAVIVVPVTAGRRKTALAALALSVAFLWLGADWSPGIALIVGLNLWTGLSVYLLEAFALIASPGPRPGRRLMHWGHWAILPVVVAAQACLFVPFRLGLGSPAALGVLVILILAVNRLGRALQLSRYFRLLLAATFYPIVFLAATFYLGGLRWMNGLGYTLLPLVFAGPVLCAVVALSTVIRPRRRRII